MDIINSYRNDKLVVSEVEYDATFEGLPQDSFGRAVIVVNKEEKTIAMTTTYGHKPSWGTALWFLYINKPFRRIVKQSKEDDFLSSFYSVQTVYYTEDDWHDMVKEKIYYTDCNGARVAKVEKELLRVDEGGFVETIEPLTVEDYRLLLKSVWFTNQNVSIGKVIRFLKSENMFRYVKPEKIEDHINESIPE